MSSCRAGSSRSSLTSSPIAHFAGGSHGAVTTLLNSALSRSSSDSFAACPDEQEPAACLSLASAIDTGGVDDGGFHLKGLRTYYSDRVTMSRDAGAVDPGAWLDDQTGQRSREVLVHGHINTNTCWDAVCLAPRQPAAVSCAPSSLPQNGFRRSSLSGRPSATTNNQSNNASGSTTPTHSITPRRLPSSTSPSLALLPFNSGADSPGEQPRCPPLGTAPLTRRRSLSCRNSSRGESPLSAPAAGFDDAVPSALDTMLMSAAHPPSGAFDVAQPASPGATWRSKTPAPRRKTDAASYARVYRTMVHGLQRQNQTQFGSPHLSAAAADDDDDGSRD